MDKSNIDNKNGQNIGFNLDGPFNFSLERNEYLNGKPIDDKIRIKAPSLCRAFIGGEWLSAEDSDIYFRPVGGGYTNKLYHCGLPEHLKKPNDKNLDVLIRIYGGWHDMIGESDAVIAQLLSDLKLGPKLLGVFPGGRLEEFIPSKTLTSADMRNPLYSEAIARKLATFHKIEAPLNKNGNWAFDMMRQFLDMLKKTDKVEEVAEIKQLPDFESEIRWLQEVVKQVHSPVVFCHNDLFGSNILMRDDIFNQMKNNLKHINDEKIIDDLLVFIDFEFCSYNNRGFDLGNHFSEWSIDYSDYPNFTWNKSGYPTEEEQRRFIRAYRGKWIEINNGLISDFDTEEHLMHEAAVYRMVANLCWAIGQWEFSKCRFEMYQHQKDEILKMRLLK